MCRRAPPAHGPEVDGFGVFSRGWGGEGEREADGASAGKRYGLVQEGHDGLLLGMWAVARWKVCGQEPGSWGGSGGAEPLLACDLDEKDEAGRAEADEVGEEAGVHEHDPGHEHRDPLGGRGFGEQPSLHTGGEADDAEHGGEHGLQDGGPVAHEQGRGLEDEDEGTMKAAMPSLKAVKPVHGRRVGNGLASA